MNYLQAIDKIGSPVAFTCEGQSVFGKLASVWVYGDSPQTRRANIQIEAGKKLALYHLEDCTFLA